MFITMFSIHDLFSFFLFSLIFYLFWVYVNILWFNVISSLGILTRRLCEITLLDLQYTFVSNLSPPTNDTMLLPGQGRPLTAWSPSLWSPWHPFIRVTHPGYFCWHRVALSAAFICGSKFKSVAFSISLWISLALSQGRWLLVNSFSFCWNKKVFFFPCFLKNNFTEYRSLGWCFIILTFTFNIVNIVPLSSSWHGIWWDILWCPRDYCMQITLEYSHGPASRLRSHWPWILGALLLPRCLVTGALTPPS